MSYLAKINLELLEGNVSYANDKGNHECVALVQKVANAPNTSSWKKGKKVIDQPSGSIPRGTVIATFDDNGNYPVTQRHAAIYVRHNANEIVVFDQWKTQGKSKKRTITLKNLPNRDVNDANYYWIVE